MPQQDEYGIDQDEAFEEELKARKTASAHSAAMAKRKTGKRPDWPLHVDLRALEESGQRIYRIA